MRLIRVHHIVSFVTVCLCHGLLCTPAAHATEAPPALAWSLAFGGAGLDTVGGMALDSAGNVYAAGMFAGTVNFDPDDGDAVLTSPSPDGSVYVVKYGPDGSLLWARTMGGTAFSTGRDIAIDAAGNAYITGWFNTRADLDPGPGEFIVTSPNLGDVFVVKLNPDGAFVWGYALSNSDSTVGEAIALDPSGAVLVTGNFRGTAQFDSNNGTAALTSGGNVDTFVLKLSPAGAFEWARRVGGVGPTRGLGIATDSTGNVLVSGSFEDEADFNPSTAAQTLRTSGGGRDGFLLKLDATGVFDWVRTMTGPQDTEGFDVAVGPLDTVHVAGRFLGPTTFAPESGAIPLNATSGEDAFAMKLDADGDVFWVAPLGVPFFSGASSIAVDSAGFVYTAGNFGGTGDFDPGPGTFNLTSAGGVDTFVSKLDAFGDFVWALSFGGPGSVNPQAIAVNASGTDIALVGSFTGSVVLDPAGQVGEVTSAGSFDGYIMKLGEGSAPLPVSLAGTIRDADTGEPISCAVVSAVIGPGIKQTNEIVAVADANGEYFFTEVPPGLYTAMAMAPGYAPQLVPEIAIAPGDLAIRDITLQPRSGVPVVRGIVTDADSGLPLVGVRVTVFVDEFFVGETHSCASGAYEVILPQAMRKDGEVLVDIFFSLDNYEIESVSALIDPDTGGTINAALNKSVLGVSFLTGRVRGQAGASVAPLAGAQVTLNGPVRTTVTTGNDGTFALDALLDGSYILTASAPGFGGSSVQRTVPPGGGAIAEFLLVSTQPPGVPGDVNGDGVVNAVDVQLVINAALGIAIDPAFQPDINGDGLVNAVDVQLVINAALGVDISGQVP